MLPGGLPGVPPPGQRSLVGSTPVKTEQYSIRLIIASSRYVVLSIPGYWDKGVGAGAEVGAGGMRLARMALPSSPMSLISAKADKFHWGHGACRTTSAVLMCSKRRCTQGWYLAHGKLIAQGQAFPQFLVLSALTSTLRLWTSTISF